MKRHTLEFKNNIIFISLRNASFQIDIRNHNLGLFMGAFCSEGTFPESKNTSIKITNRNMAFLNYVTNSLRNVFGKYAATNSIPTPEHRDSDEGFHKYYSNLVRDVLVLAYKIKPGRRVLNDEGLPDTVMKAINKNEEWVKWWLRGYIQTRYTGDGHIRIKRKEIILTKNKALGLDREFIETLIKLYLKHKRLDMFPKNIINKLKINMKYETNYPKEFLDLKTAFKNLFGINSFIQPGWIKAIYLVKRNKLVVTATYRLFIRGLDDIKKFYNQINFSWVDKRNRYKLLKCMSDMAGDCSS